MNIRGFRQIAVVAVATGLTFAAMPSAAAQDGGWCRAAASTVETRAGLPLLDWAENLGFDADGNLWVSRVLRGEVQRYDTTGTVTATVAVDAPGAIQLGPDGLLYITFGDTLTSLVPGGEGGVVRFDPTEANPVPEIFVRGLGMANGADFDADGNLYIADTGAGVVRVSPDGSIDSVWSAQTRLVAVNGLVVRDDTIFVTVMHTGEIVRIPIKNPADQSVLAKTTLGGSPIPQSPDDLALTDDGSLYVTTSMGQLVRVDPSTGKTCTVLAGEPLTSVVEVPGGLLATTLSGNILRVTP